MPIRCPRPALDAGRGWGSGFVLTRPGIGPSFRAGAGQQTATRVRGHQGPTGPREDGDGTAVVLPGAQGALRLGPRGPRADPGGADVLPVF